MDINKPKKIQSSGDSTRYMYSINNLKENIRKMRKTLRMSQEEFSDILNLNRSYLSDMERGIRNPSVMVVLDIARNLKISTSMLFKPDIEFMLDEKGQIVCSEEDTRTESDERQVSLKLRTLRMKMGYTQQDMSRIASLNRGYYSKIENGKCMPTIHIMEKISQALNCKIWELFE